MTETVFILHYHVSDATMLPEMDVRTANASRADVYQAVVGAWLGNITVHETELVLRIGLNGNVLWVVPQCF